MKWHVAPREATARRPHRTTAPRTRRATGCRPYRATTCQPRRAAVVLGAAPLVIAALLGVPARSLASRPAATVVRAQIVIVHRGTGSPSLVSIRVDPPSAAGRGELLLSIYNTAGIINRQVLESVAPGVYEAQYVFPVGGTWRYYMRFGPGQAGFASAGYVHITPEAGSVDSANAVFRSGLRRAPAYVQPLGYAAFGLMALLALAGVSAILIRLAHCGPHAGTSPQDC
jgi:hypothetical protein